MAGRGAGRSRASACAGAWPRWPASTPSRAATRLNETQVRGFLQEILQSDCMPTCPHGRPIVTEITRYALEKRFKRVQ